MYLERIEILIVCLHQTFYKILYVFMMDKTVKPYFEMERGGGELSYYFYHRLLSCGIPFKKSTSHKNNSTLMRCLRHPERNAGLS